MLRLQSLIIVEKKIKRCKPPHQPSVEAKDVNIFCKGCYAFACFGSDISVIGKHEHEHSLYVVHEDSFKPKYTIKVHKKPRYLRANTIFKLHKVHCAQCDADWGVECTIKPQGLLLPVIKCKSFIFQGTSEPVKNWSVKKWSSAPFRCENFTDKFPMNPKSEDSLWGWEQIACY